MHRVQFRRSLLGERRNLIWLCSLMVVLALVVSACGGTAEPEAAAPEAAATEAESAEESAEEPAEEEAEATEEPAEEEAEATEEPAEAEEEAEATAEPSEAPMEISGDAEAGQYVATLTGGCGCHFNRDIGALAGGRDFEVENGVAYAANITPDVETGIGDHTQDELIAMLRTGAHPEGHQLVSVMPYERLSVLSDVEVTDLVAYLFSLEPVANEVPARDVSEEPEPFTPATDPPAEAPTEPVARGEQLVILSRCGGCHTPWNEDGTQNMDMMLAGGRISEDDIASNITPDEATGIGGWSDEEIATYLTTGARPDGTEAQGAMAQQIERRFNILTEGDAAAIAAYLKSVPAVENDPYDE